MISIKNEKSYHIQQGGLEQNPYNWNWLFGHKSRQTIKSNSQITPTACSWILKNDFSWNDLSTQDLKLSFKKASNVKIYISSYFFENKESQTQYFTNSQDLELLLEPSTILTFEMYNTTEIYIVPQDNL